MNLPTLTGLSTAYFWCKVRNRALPELKISVTMQVTESRTEYLSNNHNFPKVEKSYIKELNFVGTEESIKKFIASLEDVLNGQPKHIEFVNNEEVTEGKDSCS